MLKLKGAISISRPSSYSGKGEIRIEIIDESSHCVAAEFRMDLADFAEALTGMGHVEGRLLFNNSGVIGKIREHKRERVELPCWSFEATDEMVRQAVAAYEVDGWKGRDKDARNNHNRLDGGKGNSYSVTYERYVERKDGER